MSNINDLILKVKDRPHLFVVILLLMTAFGLAYSQYGKGGAVKSNASGTTSEIVGPPATCNFYASPTGSTSGDGSLGNPWEINTALGQGSNLSGQTLCLKGGLYNTRLTSNLVNATVRSAPGEWAKFDSYIQVTLLNDISAYVEGVPNPCTWSTLAQGLTIGDPGGGVEFSDGDGVTLHNPSGNTANCIGNDSPHAAGSVAITKNAPATIYGSGTVYRDFEIYNSNPKRVYDVYINDPGGARTSDFFVYAPNTKLVNLVVHDLGDGIFGTMSATDLEINGVLTYNNGSSDTLRGNGHGLYLQNPSTNNPKKIKDVISFNNFAFGMKAYGEGAGQANGFEFDGVISFNNGSPASFPGNINGYSSNTRMSNLFIGPASTNNPGTGIVIKNNRTFNPYNTTGGVGAGYAGVRNNDIIVQNNYFVDGFGLNYWLNALVTGNTIINNSSNNPLMTNQLGATDSWTFDNNQYFDLHDPFENGTVYDIHLLMEGINTANGLGGGILAFTETPNANGKGWKEWTGFDTNSTYISAAPTTNEIFIRPNEYEQGRANIAVYNWTNSSTVNVNLSSTGLQNGQAFKIVKADNYFGNPIYTGTYNSSSPTVGLDMTDTTVVGPIGHSFTPASTCPEFCVFVVLPVYSSGAPTDTTPPVLSSGSPSGSQPAGTTSANLTLSTNETATCKYGTTAGVAYSSLPSTFTTTNSTSHSTTVSSLSNGTSYNYYIRCQDTSGNPTTQDFTISFSVASPTGDTTAPTVSITAPSAGATVSGTSTGVSATASDNIGVAGVQFKLDGSNLGSEDTASPYSIVWNTNGASNGSHTLTATARDFAGNTTTSAAVNVTVNNTPVPTTVSTPSISPNGGTFTTAQSVSLATATSGATIRYTTDGSTPSTTAGTIYSSPFTISNTSTVKAIAYKTGSTDSTVSSATFTINTVTTGPAPRILSFSLASKTQTTAILRWKTDIASTGSISYGASRDSLNLSASETTTPTCTSTSCIHTITLTGLTRNTTYYYRITATNNNASTTSIRSSFKTRR